jgi:sulfate permease, SulP family
MTPPVIAPWLRGYRRDWFSRDAVAGVVAACVVVPQAIAYAGLAGLPVQVGLYAALVPMVVYALLGSSRALSVSVTSTISILTASAIAASADGPSRAALLAILVGVILLVAGLARLGFLADLISLPILTGYKAGTGLFILSGQLGKVLGISVGGKGFIENVGDLISGLGHISGATLALGAATLALLVWMRRAVPKIPGPLVAVALGIVAVQVLDLTAHGVAVVGSVKSGLPPFGVPSFTGWRILAPAAAGIALMSAVESLAAGRALVKADDRPVDANRELVALGAASVGGGLFSAYPSGGGLSQSVVQSDAGARTQLASVVCAAVVALVLTALTGVLAHLAQATLGALVIVAAVALINPAEIARIARVRRRDFVLSLIALAGVLVFGVLDGVILAVAASIGVLVYQTNRPPVDRLGIDPATGDLRQLSPGEPSGLPPGVIAVRPRGRLFFANARRVCQNITEIVANEDPPPRIVIVDFIATPDLEVTAVAAIHEMSNALRQNGVQVWGAGFSPEEGRMFRGWGPDPNARGFATVERAIAATTP